MSSNHHQDFRLGPWTVEPLRGAITGQGGEAQHLEPKVMEVLALLARRPNELVTREQLLAAVWSEHVAADQLLTRAVSELRRALHDDRGRPAYIETVPKRGYRLIGAVRPIEGSKAGGDLAPPPPPASRFSKRSMLVVVILPFLLGLIYLAFRGPAESPAVPELTNADAVANETRTAGSSGMSIAVLPFVNLSDDPDNAYFSEGLSEEIRNLLATIPELKVIGRTSSFAFAKKNEDVRVIGKLLGVKTILEGSVRKSGDRVRITAELVDASDGSQIWSKTYRRTMTDIFELQDDLAAAIIDALELHIRTYPARGRPTGIAEAYALFLQARLALNIQDAQTAEKVLRQALEIDPDFAEAYELLAHVYWTESIPGLEPAEEQRLIRDAAAKALAIDADLEFARALYLEAETDGYSLPDVIEAQIAVVRHQPNNPAAFRTLSWNLLIAGYLEEALRVAERFVEIDPLSSIAHVRHAAALRAVGRTDEARAAMQTASRLTPVSLSWFIGEARLADKQDEAAIGYLKDAVRHDEDDNPDWIEDLVTGARNAQSGQAHLDRGIPAVIESMPAPDAESLQQDLNRWYLYFGYLDRYYEILLASNPAYSNWTDAMYYVWNGTIFRELGFTAHPKYLEVAELMGFIDVWERRGPPDYCEKVDGRWVCK